MRLESVTCNHCGAPLQVPEGTKYVTCLHCDRQLTVIESGGARFTQVVEELHAQVARLTRQNEAEALDRAWEREKEQYLETDKDGFKRIPTKSDSVVGGVIIAAFGTAWTIFACGIAGGEFGGLGWLIPLFGIGFVVIGLIRAVSNYQNAERYEQAHREYQERRREVAGESSAPVVED